MKSSSLRSSLSYYSVYVYSVFGGMIDGINHRFHFNQITNQDLNYYITPSSFTDHVFKLGLFYDE